jgi:Zn-dependent protease/predicted transcriptional regulator
MKSAMRILTWRGIEVRAHWSLLVIASLLAWSLADSAFPTGAKGYSTSSYWVAGVLAAIVFLMSITAHELGHSVVAQRRCIRVRSITLWLFGGVAQLDRRPQTWRDELAVALAGPAVSVSVGIGSMALAALVWSTSGSGLAAAALAWLGSTNVLLAVFNMLPGAPLDGGRVFAAWRWRRHGSPVRARQEAAKAGTMVAQTMIAIGVVLTFAGAGISGLWLAFLGWFLVSAARAEYDDIDTHHVLEHVRVGEVMTRRPATVPESMTLETLVGCVLPKIHGSTVPVVRDGQLKGLITPDHLRAVSPGDWRHRTTADIATPAALVVTATPNEMLLDALDRMDDTHRRIVVVDDASHVIGLITPTDLARTVRVARLQESLQV